MPFLPIVLALSIASPAPCVRATLPDTPQTSSVSMQDVADVRKLIDAGDIAHARAFWSKLAGWSPARGTTAYGRADALFKAGNYRAAFSFIDRSLFCGGVSELNPQAQDSGAAPLMDRALRAAAGGNLEQASVLAKKAEDADGASIEARYFAGLIEAARGHPDRARIAWKSAIDIYGYAQPPDGWSIPRAQQAAIERYLSTS